MKRAVVMTAMAVVCSMATISQAAGFEGLALTPDGKTLLVGGSNRVIYTLNAETLEVTGRHGIGHTIDGIHCSTDGKKILVSGGMGDDDSFLLDATSFELIDTLENVSHISPGTGGGRLVARQGDHRRSSLVILSEKDFSIVRTIELPAERRLASCAMSADGKRVVALSRPMDDETEIKAERSDIRQIRDRDERNRVEQRHDQKCSHLMVYNADTGDLIRDQKLWFSSSRMDNRLLLSHADGVTRIIQYHDCNAVVDAEGHIELFTLHLYGYALGISPDGGLLVGGSLMGHGVCGHVMDVAGGEKTPVEITGRLPGFPEYFSCLLITADGRIFGGSTCYRVFQLQADGEKYIFKPIVPVY